MSFSAGLPIAEVVADVRQTLAHHPLALLQAPPGAGKSTALPLELLQESWLTGQKIIILQPRRVAVRAVASRLAESLGEEVGGTVGYRMRFESRVSAHTRLEVVTEGILTRRLQRDPGLSGVGLVILDEFHERSLNADLALALLREVQGALRDDLRVLVMSATLDPSLPQKLAVPLIESAGRAYPVDIRYLPTDPAGRIEDAVAGAIRRALNEETGDILAFLPGVREIRNVLTTLAPCGTCKAAEQRGPAEGRGEGATELSQPVILPLYGDLSPAEQRRALLPDPAGRRKVVLATSIAETSLTIEGVRVVVDGGQSRTQQFDPATGLTRMVTGRVSADAATQRAGRAGRMEAGICYRLWSERTQALLPAAQPPELLSADLTRLTLELAAWGAADPAELPWLDAPPAPRIAAARSLLRGLDALDETGRITAAGQKLLDFPTHPRLAHLLAEAEDRALAADVAALLEERDPFPAGSGADLSERVEALRTWRSGNKVPGENAVWERTERLAKQWRKVLNPSPAASRHPLPQGARVNSAETVGELLALAYPERLALARAEATGMQKGRFLLAGGQGAALPEGDALAGAGALAVAHLNMTGAEGRIFLAAPLDPAFLREKAVWADAVRWDARTGTLLAQQELKLGALVLETRPLKDVSPELKAGAVADAIRAEGLHLLTFSPAAAAFRARVESVRGWNDPSPLASQGPLPLVEGQKSPLLGEREGGAERRKGEGSSPWPDLSDPALLATLEHWLGPQLASVRTRDDLARLDLLPALQALLPWNLTRELDDLAPTHLTVPSGSRIKLDYRPGEAPILAVKLQELFGLADTPTVNGGRVPVLLHLLSPAGRPVQVTQDLRSFWNSSYFEVRKDLRGRYPKHPWPDDPWTHEPTRWTKKKLGG